MPGAGFRTYLALSKKQRLLVFRNDFLPESGVYHKKPLVRLKPVGPAPSTGMFSICRIIGQLLGFWVERLASD